MGQNYSFISKRFSLHTSSKELKDLAIAWLFISIAFAIVQNGASFSSAFLISIAISGFTVGIAFIFHEMSHKIVAQRYHCWAEFRADITMLSLALLMSFLGFVFIAPGAVMIYGNVTKKQNGIISMAGPLTNIILAIILLPFALMLPFGVLANHLVSYGFMINAWLALFNMIPFWNFDGAKIYSWSKTAYIIIIIAAAILVFFSFVRPL